MSNIKKDLVLLLQRPNEPVFSVRTDEDGRTVRFEAPIELLADRYQPIASEVQNRFGDDDVDRTVPVQSIALPDIEFARVLSKKKPFSNFNKRHQEIAGQLTKIFMDAPDLQALMSYAVYCRGQVNAQLFNYCFTVALQHRADTQDVAVNSVVELFPSQFVDPAIITEALEENQFVPQGVRRPIVIPPNYTATEREPEQRLAYWREDIGLNLHHWHWHLVYPGSGETRIVQKDRRGELFYYMHSQCMSRYNIERFANNLGRVQALNNFREALPEGYFPKLLRSSNNTTIPPRFANAQLRDVERPNDFTEVTVNEMERWRSRIYDAIDNGMVMDASGNAIPLDEVRGIDILGDLVEPSDLSVNQTFYGQLHNMGHNMLAFIHDPDGRYLENLGVMGENTTAMRDPIFYRWHGFVEELFQRYKNTLAPYAVENQLLFNGVSVGAIRIQGRNNIPANTLLTYWQRSELNLGTGLDFGREGDIFAQFTHLQHAPYEYIIEVNNDGGSLRRGTCRIFMAPRADERGIPLNFRDQRLLTIEMDRFNVNLNPGMNTIRRRSEDSSITIPYQRTFRNVSTAAQQNQNEGFNFCGCGWPQHLLVPKGNAEGMDFDVFVMVSNYEDDRVEQSYDADDICADASSFCGIRNKLYPDKRAMGFPFDRQFPDAPSMGDFVNLCSNMNLGSCRILHSNRYVTRTE